MTGGLRIPWPQGIATRLGLLLVAGIGLFGVVTGLLWLQERREQGIDTFARSLSTRMVAMVEVLEQAPESLRGQAVRSFSDRHMQVRLSRERPSGPDWLRPGQLDIHGAHHLTRLHPRTVLVNPDGAGDGHRSGRLRFVVAVDLGQGLWANFRFGHPRVPHASGVIWLGLTGVLVVLALIWGAHRMTRPLRRMADAADRLHLDAGPLPEQGSREVRNTTRAFNRMTERIRRLVNDRTLLLAAISHDLKTMLTRLRLRAEFIEDAEQQRKAIADIDEMSGMLDATLAFARDEATDEARQPLDLAALLRGLATDDPDRVTYTGPERLPVHARPQGVRRMFANLVENAVRYGEEAAISASRRPDAVEVCIGDRGPGIPRAFRERVFEPFFRLELSRNRETGGTGLGLAMVRAVLQRHGGAILLEDRPGGGCLVRVTLPLHGSVPPAGDGR